MKDTKLMAAELAKVALRTDVVDVTSDDDLFSAGQAAYNLWGEAGNASNDMTIALEALVDQIAEIQTHGRKGGRAGAYAYSKQVMRKLGAIQGAAEDVNRKIKGLKDEITLLWNQLER